MGIYDREYYRKDGPSYLDRLIPRGQVCKWLIGLNVLIFILQLVTKRDGIGDAWLSNALMLDTSEVMHGQVWRLLTYAFLHSVDSVMHILINMLFLWWFGSEIEELYGSKEFLAFYLLAAVLGGLAFQVQAQIQDTRLFCVGASGAVTAVLVLYAFHFPNAMILVLFVLPVPIWIFVIFQVAQDAFQLFGNGRTQVAVAVHLGGAAFAALYYKYDWRITNFSIGIPSWSRERSKPRLRVYHPEDDMAVPVTSGSAAELDEHLDAKLDAVLEKLGRHGRESLTEGEREILLRASEIYKKKRT